MESPPAVTGATPPSPTGEVVRWLDPAEQRVWRSFLDASRLLFDALDRQLQAEAGMPHAYYEILVRLSEAGDRTMRMSDLADSLSSSRSRLSHAVARLERHGWVVRATCPSDGRFTIATLTDAGHEKLAAAAPGHVAAVRQLVLDAVGPDELAVLGTLADKILEGSSGPCGSSGCPTSTPEPGRSG